MAARFTTRVRIVGFVMDDVLRTGPWKSGLLPFCDRGCAIFSCVDCTDAAHHIFAYEDFGVSPERYTLTEWADEKWGVLANFEVHKSAFSVARRFNVMAAAGTTPPAPPL